MGRRTSCSTPSSFSGGWRLLVPRTRINLILYHGVLGPRAAWRAEVVRRQPSVQDGAAGVKDSAAEPVREADPAATAWRHARGQCWASLMARTFRLDVLACPRCGGRLRLIALIEEAAVIDRILRHLGVPTEIPPRVPPARHHTAWGVPTMPVGTTARRCLIPVPDNPQQTARPLARWRCALWRGPPPARDLSWYCDLSWLTRRRREP